MIALSFLLVFFISISEKCFYVVLNNRLKIVARVIMVMQTIINGVKSSVFRLDYYVEIVLRYTEISFSSSLGILFKT